MSVSESNGAEKPPKYDCTYRFRTHRTLIQRAARVAAKRGFGDASDIGREGVIKLIEAEEERLGLPKIEAANGEAAHP